MNDQRKAIFEQRRELMTDADLADTIADMRHHVIDDLVAATSPTSPIAEQWDMAALQQSMHDIFAIDVPVSEWAAKEEGSARPRFTSG